MPMPCPLPDYVDERDAFPWDAEYGEATANGAVPLRLDPYSEQMRIAMAMEASEGGSDDRQRP